MLKVEHPIDYPKGVNSEIVDLLKEEQLTNGRSSLKRVKRFDNGKQLSKDSFTNIDVPADGSCLFWAVTLAYLLPVKGDDNLFQQRYEALFGNEETVLQNLDSVRTFIYSYNPLLELDDFFIVACLQI